MKSATVANAVRCGRRHAFHQSQSQRETVLSHARSRRTKSGSGFPSRLVQPGKLDGSCRTPPRQIVNHRNCETSVTRAWTQDNSPTAISSSSFRLGSSADPTALRPLFYIAGRPVQDQAPASEKKVDAKLISTQRQMLSHTTIVATPTADTSGASVALHCENRRYIFGNVAEGTQRLLGEHKVSMMRLEEVALTGPVNYQTCGGLLGFILTIAGAITSSRNFEKEHNTPRKQNNRKLAGIAALSGELRLRGGENLDFFLAMCRRFILRTGMPVRTIETLADPRLDDEKVAAAAEPDWVDENIMVWNVPLHAETEVAERPEGAEGADRGAKRRKTSRDDDVSSSGSSEGNSSARTLTEHDRELLKSVVSQMFESAWRLDALVETTLSQVKPPAAIFVRGEGDRLEKYRGPMPGSAPDVPDIPVLVRTPWPGSKVERLPPTSPSSSSMCYIVKLQPRRGKFNREAADRLGIPQTMFKKLIAGNNYVTDAGVTVTPDMVVAPTVQGVGFAIMEVPSADYVSSVLSRPEWSQSKITDGIKAIYWNLGPGVVRDERLLAFMRERPELRHIVFSPDTSPNEIAFQGAFSVTVQHHAIDPPRFPLQAFSNRTDEEALKQQQQQQPLPYELARPGARLQLAPTVVFQDDAAIPPMDTQKPLRYISDPVHKAIRKAHYRIALPAFAADVAAANEGLICPDAEVITLGTGSSMPSKYRNVSATMVRVPHGGYYLFDCGENTIGQIRRHFGLAGADGALRDLRVLFLSHLHADHHLGAVSLIRAWEAATAGLPDEPRLVVVATNEVLEYFREYPQVQPLGDRVDLLPVTVNGWYNPSRRICPPLEFSAEESAKLGGLTRIDCVAVDHCFAALATAFTWGDTGFKVAYSGDCRPSREFVQIGRDATLLIHESTFDDELAADAKAKKHSTMSEAIDVACQMRARRVMLTHFSQRYPKVPIIEHESDSEGSDSGSGSDWGRSKRQPPRNQNRRGGGWRPWQRESTHQIPAGMAVLVGFDHMRVQLRDFHEAAEFLPALRKLYQLCLVKDDDDETSSSPARELPGLDPSAETVGAVGVASTSASGSGV